MSDNAPKNLVYVGGLDLSVTEGDLYTAFIPFGEIVATYLPRNQSTGKLQGFGYVEFEHAEDAKNAIDNMNLTEFFGSVTLALPLSMSEAEKSENTISEFSETEESFSTENGASESSQLSSENESVEELSSSEVESSHAEESNEEEVDNVTVKRTKVEEDSQETPKPQTPPQMPKAIFGSAAKSIVSFNSLAGASAVPAKSLFAQAIAAQKEKEESESEKSSKADSNYEVVTGEEGEDTLISVKGKLFEFNPVSKDWIERGTGMFKLNIDTKNKKYRLLMRMDTVQKLILNSSIFNGMVCEIAQPKNLRFSAYSLDAKIQTFLLRTKTVEEAESLQEQVKRVLDALTETDC